MRRTAIMTTRSPAGQSPLFAARLLQAGWRYGWAGAISLGALPLVLLFRLAGGRAQVHTGVLEAAGGRAGNGMRRYLGIAAITLGHVVLAADALTLERTRRHERVHVRQYERWGPLFPLAYGLAGLLARARGGSAYRDNHFEREAFAADDPARR